jgi:diguanylate cyclase (GGDEF)-like protein
MASDPATPPTAPPSGAPRPDRSVAVWLLAGFAGITAAALAAAMAGTWSLPRLGQILLALALGSITTLALAPWTQAMRASRQLRDITRLVRWLSSGGGPGALPQLESDSDEVAELYRAIRRTLESATAHRVEAKTLRRTMDESIRKETGRATDRLRREAQSDALTGLGNRRAFDEQVDGLLEEAVRQGHILTALVVDIDNFKAINDTLGHPVGDECLSFVGSLLAAGLRSQDRAYRYGGDEFVVLMPGATAEAAEAVARRIAALFAQMPWPHRAVARPTFSIGVAAARPGDAMDARELVRRADEAMYSVKRAGRARVMARRDLRGAA